ncbi:MAG: apolipoprotein N-acyltransferase, partial [Pseudomonadota bacterium]|nr:apolipoprotein N-acyltransferase [Pseudomonadota bacterium]
MTETSLIDRLSRRRHRAAAAAALAGAAGSFALPPFGLVPLVAALSLPALQLGRATSSGEAGLIAGAAGFGWFLASLWWISLSLVTGNTGHWPLIPLPLFGIPLLLALFWVPAGVLAHRLGRSAPARVLWFAATLTICEWARGHVATGFPWNAPGYLFSAHVSLLQNASFLGLYGLSFLALLWAFAAAIWKLGRRRSAFVMVLILPLAALAGLVRLERLPDPPGDMPSKIVRLVQPA